MAKVIVEVYPPVPQVSGCKRSLPKNYYDEQKGTNCNVFFYVLVNYDKNILLDETQCAFLFPRYLIYLEIFF